MSFQKLTVRLVSNINPSKLLFFQGKSPCRNNPCGAHGQCFENAHSYIFMCEVGYTGQRCLEESELFKTFCNKHDQF